MDSAFQKMDVHKQQLVVQFLDLQFKAVIDCKEGPNATLAILTRLKLAALICTSHYDFSFFSYVSHSNVKNFSPCSSANLSYCIPLRVACL